jgi:hypothetical protein
MSAAASLGKSNLQFTINRSKKSYKWSFDARVYYNVSEEEEWETTFARSEGHSDTLTKQYRIEIRDSVNTGKITLTINGVAVMHKIKMYYQILLSV